MRNPSRILISGLVFLLSACAIPRGGEETGILHEIARGNDFYNKKQFREAADIYEEIVSREFENGFLYYNLGNAHFRLGDMGRAIANYLRARKLAPRFEDVDANLRYAIAETEDKVFQPAAPFIKNIVFWADDFSKLEYLQALLAVNLLFWLTAAARIVKRADALETVRKILLLALALTTLSAGTKFYADAAYRAGVILDERVDVKSGQDADHVTLFRLHAGAVVNITGSEGDWYKIEAGEEKKGWVRKQFIDRV